MFFYLLQLALAQSSFSSCVVVEYNCTGERGVDYVQPNQEDCSRFTYCLFGVAAYWQCRKGFIFDFCEQSCIRVISSNSRYECFNATNTQCVVQKERPYDPLQVDSMLETTTRGSPPTTVLPPIAPIIPAIMPAPLQPSPLSPYNPYLYGPGTAISSGGMGFNLNLNYNPLIGWGFNSNLALETPWSTMLAPLLGLPMYPPIGMPYGGMMMPGIGAPLPPGIIGPGLAPNQPMGMPFPPIYRHARKRALNRAIKANAVRVNACVPTDPWPESPITLPS